MTPAPQLLLWGVPELRLGDVPLVFGPERRFQLLAVLGLQAGQWVERDRLAALLWPERAAAEARRNLRKVVFDAHALPAMQGLEAGPHALRWAVHSDVAAFHQHKAQDPVAALAWRRAPPLQGLDDPRNAAFAEWLQAERARLDHAWQAAAMAALQAQPDAAARAALARQVLDVEPLDEAALAALLRAEGALGHAAEAQAAYRRYATLLAQELGVEPSRALRDLLHAPPAPLAAPALLALPPQPSAPPVPADPGFVGRRSELAELQALLEQPECRCLSVLGPGGVGKSRLVRQALPRLAALFTPCTWLGLQDAASAEELPARWAQALGLTLDATQPPLPQLLRQVGAQRSLLVLDNAEHLSTLPALLQDMLAGAPGLVLLLTSRQRLALPGQAVLPLSGLAVPDDESRDLEAAQAFDAVRLFDQGARAARRGFELGRHLEAVLAICDTVAGLPLAIELAAAWVRLLSPEQIHQDLQALGSGLDLLERDPGTGAAPARPEHSSLRAVLQGSWQLLGPRERRALAALSVFEGGFTRAAALAVAGCSLPLLSALVDASLLALDEHGRFALHPVVHSFAAERAAEDAAQQAALQDRHARHFAQHLAGLAPLVRSDPRALRQGVEADYANLRAAWRHALAQQQLLPLLEMVNVWRGYFEHRVRLDEGLAELRPALALSVTGDSALRLLSCTRHAMSTLSYRRGDLAQALALAEAALPTAEACGERGALKGCLLNIGLCLWNRGRSEAALAPLARALALAEEDGDRHGMAAALNNRAVALKSLGRYDEALSLNERALVLERELGNPRGVSSKLNNIGNLHRARHDWAAARPWFEEGLGHAREFGLDIQAAFLELNLGLTLIDLGEAPAARRHLQAVLDQQRQAGQLQLSLAAELGLARLDIAGGAPAQARARLCTVVQQARLKAFNTHPAQAAVVYGELLAAQGRLVEAAAVWQMAAAEPVLDEPDRAVARLRLAQLQERPGPVQRSLDEVLAELMGGGPETPK